MNVKLSQKIFETPIVRRDNFGDVMYTLLITMDEIAVIKITCIQSSDVSIPRVGSGRSGSRPSGRVGSGSGIAF